MGVFDGAGRVAKRKIGFRSQISWLKYFGYEVLYTVDAYTFYTFHHYFHPTFH